MGNDHPFVHCFFAMGGNIIRNPLRGTSNCISIHAVGTSTHFAAQTGGAKRQILIKAVFDLRRIIFDRSQLTT